jgi:hypothetical protein
MEDFFTPTRRLRDQSNGNEVFERDEVQLSVPLEDFMMQPWDWSDLLSFITGGQMRKIVWITEDAFLAIEDGSSSYNLVNNCFGYSAMMIAHLTPASRQTKYLPLAGRLKLPLPMSCETKSLFIAMRTGSALFLSAGLSNIFWRAATTSNSQTLDLATKVELFGLCSAFSLSKLLEGSPLRSVSFKGYGFEFEEAHCRVLANLEKTDLEIQFLKCTLDAQDAEEAFIEWIRNAKVVTRLVWCKMKASILSALSGNSSIKTLMIDAYSECGKYGRDQIRSLAHFLPGNRGIEYIMLSNLTCYLLTDEGWSLLFRSLWMHPRIRTVNIFSGNRTTTLPAESKSSRMHDVLQMLRCNTVVQEIKLSDDLKDEEIYETSIVPRLEMNRSRFEEQRQALKQEDPSIRSQLLGRALYVVRCNADLLFRFLSENVPAFVRTDEDNPIIFSGQKKRKAQA